MSVRFGLFLVAPLFASATAFAQAPGETEATDPADPYPTEDQVQPPSAAPVVQPAAEPPAASNPCGGGRAVDVMRNRFAVGINFGGMSVSVDDENSDNASEASFHTAELSLRYRATPHFELELLLSGGRQVLEDDSEGDLAMGGGTLAARYRFRPYQAWNWWLMGGLGATVIEHHAASQDARDNATRGHVAFGIGLERRFRHLALHAEARAYALGARKDQEMDTAQPVPDGGGRLPPLDPPSNDVRRAESLSAGQFTLGASFYF